MERIYVKEDGATASEKTLEGYFEWPRAPEIGETIEFELGGEEPLRREVTDVVLKVSTATGKSEVAEVHVRRGSRGA
jgi:hypothetical protein